MPAQPKVVPNSDEIVIINKISGGELTRIDECINACRQQLTGLKERVTLARNLGFIGKFIWGKDLKAATAIEDSLKGFGFAREHLISETMKMAAFHREREKLGYQPAKGSPSKVQQGPSVTLKALAAASSSPVSP